MRQRDGKMEILRDRGRERWRYRDGGMEERRDGKIER